MGQKRMNFNSDAAVREDMLEGRNAVFEALKAGRTIDKLLVAKGDREGSLIKLTAMARQAGAVVQEADRRKLDSMSPTGAHQGVIAMCAMHEYASVEDILSAARESDRPGLIVICDEINDPHNLGAVIRTANAAGAAGVIIPKRRSAGLSAAAVKASAGASEHTLVARVANLPSAIDELKKNGFWILGADMAGSTDYFNADMTGASAVVIGSEGAGIGRLVKEKCDFLLRIPMFGQINSLNASVAGAILIYEAVRQRAAKL